MNGTLIAVLIYLIVQLGIGAWVSRRIGTEADYLVAGRSLGYPLAIFSLFATWFGAETVISGASRAYERGFTFSSPEPFGYGLCLLLMGFIYAIPLWKRKLTTLADLFRQRYSVSVERLAAIILLPASVLWAAAQLRAFGSIIATAAPGMSIEVALATAAGFTMLYTAFGGLLADAITDLLQGAVIVVGLLLVAIMTVVAVGGLDGVGAALAQSASSAVALPPEDVSMLGVVEAWAIPLFGSVIAAELVVRVVAARTSTVARNASLIAGVMYIAVGLLPVFIALAGSSLLPSLDDAEQAMPAIAQQVLSPVFHTVFIGALVSAILSTIDSTLLTASGLMSHNLVVPFFKLTGEREKLRLARLGVLAFGIVAWLLARGAESVFSLIELSSSVGTAGIMVVVTFALFSKFGRARAAHATLIASVGAYAIGAIANLEAPFLLSLIVSFAIYVGAALTERRSPALDLQP